MTRSISTLPGVEYQSILSAIGVIQQCQKYVPTNKEKKKTEHFLNAKQSLISHDDSAFQYTLNGILQLQGHKQTLANFSAADCSIESDLSKNRPQFFTEFFFMDIVKLALNIPDNLLIFKNVKTKIRKQETRFISCLNF